MMEKVSYPQFSNTFFKFSTLLFAFVNLYFSSCAPQKTVPKEPSEVGSSMPVNISEIREIKHNSKEEISHEGLDLSGQVFTKTMASDSVQLTPCDSCNIKMNPSNNTTTIINLKTDRNGQFTFTGKKNTYSFFLHNPGLNQVEIHNVDLSKGGSNNIIIVIGKGDKLEKFYVTKKDGEFTWSLDGQPQ